MRRILILLACTVLSGAMSFGSALGTSSRTVIPAQVQQIISVDYRALRNSPTALALKDRVLPDNLKQFETALKGFGLNPDTDVEQLTFAAFHEGDKMTRFVGLAQGQFPLKKIYARMKLNKITGTKYRNSNIYPMNGGMYVVFLDDYSLLFGETKAVKAALDARDGESQNLSSNSEISDMISSVDSGAVWSVLDASGTQNMLRSTLGDASKLTDYDLIKKRLTGSRYTMDFNSGVTFDLDVVTSDTITAATLSSLLKAGVLFRKMNASSSEKVALESVTVDSDSSVLKLRFKTDDKKFQALLQSDLFASVSK